MENLRKLFEYVENDDFITLCSVVSSKQTVLITDYFSCSLLSKLEQCGFYHWCVFPTSFDGEVMCEVLI